jgi:hypothetical protein
MFLIGERFRLPFYLQTSPFWTKKLTMTLRSRAEGRLAMNSPMNLTFTSKCMAQLQRQLKRIKLRI